MMPKLTIGMAHYDDYDGLWGTIQGLRTTHHEVMAECEIVVVDNNPSSPDGRRAKDLVKSWLAPHMNAKYFPCSEVHGTSAPRDRVFREASGDAVMCIDCHIHVVPGAIKRLIDYYDRYPDTRDLLSGPLLYDDLVNMATHFEDEWSDRMRGVWAFDERGRDIDADPFEIPAMGLGLFSCRQDAWLGFNPAFTGFGGEEYYIHEKYRQAGAKCLCLPFLRWPHRFADESEASRKPPPYLVTIQDRVRNYIIGHKELGIPLDRAKEHFLSLGMPEAEWNGIEQAVDRGIPWPRKESGCCGQQASLETLEALYATARDTPSDIHAHCEKLRELASQCDHVVDMGKRHEVSSIAMMAGQPKEMTLVSPRLTPAIKMVHKQRGQTRFSHMPGDSLSTSFASADMLFVDTHHNAQQLTAELERHACNVKRWIVMHDTEIHGEVGDDGGPGLLVALRQFMMDHPEWSVVYHTQDNNGLTVIGCDARDKPDLPPTVEMGAAFVKAFLGHVADGMKKTDHPALKERLVTCTLCDQRVDNRCSVCGCFSEEKAAWRSEVCPLGKWPKLEAT